MLNGQKAIRMAGVFAWVFVGLACNVFDKSIAVSIASRENRVDASPDNGARGGIETTNVSVPVANGTVGVGGSGNADSGIRKGCGDGIVIAPEKCDIGIAVGEIGACPHSDGDCPAEEPCMTWVYNGKTGCDADCRAYVPECISGDNCCPSFCNRDNDADCPATCGNGIVEKEFGETCEPAATNIVERIRYAIAATRAATRTRRV